MDGSYTPRCENTSMYPRGLIALEASSGEYARIPEPKVSSTPKNDLITPRARHAVESSGCVKLINEAFGAVQKRASRDKATRGLRMCLKA